MLVSAAFLSTLLGLVAALGPREQCVETVNAKPGETCASVAAEVGTTLDTVERLNPGVDCGTPFPGPDTTALCTRSYTPTCAAWVTATEDTCDYLLPLYHLSKEQFVQNNDNIDANCDLVVGQEYCATIDSCVVHAAECCKDFPDSIYCSYV
ncbi:hypothetical protein AURDEDRAFT_162600 [Auricularia subglabra TFB-10046 SS5]|nr:hypothetical protein AURDEDRAFT_162600 [Auricularia subglabra TFB-10046 SS5]